MAVRAKDLNSCFPTSYSASQRKSTLDPFWATRLWQHLVQHVKSNVHPSRKRHVFKYYDDVFDGGDLVNVVYQCLTSCSLTAIQKPVSRKNAVKVCQVLMDNKLFECITPKGHSKFEDGSSKLYRFITDVSRDETTEGENKENSHRDVPTFQKVPGNFRASVRYTSQNHGKVHLQSIRRTASLRVLDSRTKNVEKKECSANGKTSLRHFSNIKPASDFFEESISEELHTRLRDQALMHLLVLIDLPVLESILAVPPTLGRVSVKESELVITNDMTGLVNICLPSKYGNISNIPWVSAASQCLGRRPAGLESLWSLQACKLLCYQNVLEHYSNLPEPLMPCAFVPICTAILELVKSDKRSKALLACQLLLIVMPWQRRQQLQSLLFFLHLVIEDIFVSVDKKVTNYEAVSRGFLSSVMYHQCVSKENFQILFDFMLYRVHKLFQKPSCLHQSFSPDLSFCRRVDCNEMKSVSQELTTQKLKELAFFVMDSTTMKLAEKKQWLKTLKKCHQEVYRATQCS